MVLRLNLCLIEIIMFGGPPCYIIPSRILRSPYDDGGNADDHEDDNDGVSDAKSKCFCRDDQG